MLSALELARRIEAGTLSPRAVVDLCAEAIAAHESEIGAFAALDLDGGAPARRTAAARRRCRCWAAGRHQGHLRHGRSARPRTARRSMPATGRRPTPRWSLLMRRAGGLVLGKTVTTEFASRSRPARAIRATRRTRPAGRRRARRRRWPPAWCRSRSAARPAARSSGLPPIAASPASSRRSGCCRPSA